MTDFVEMFRHWNAGRSQVQIYETLDIDRRRGESKARPRNGFGGATTE